MLHHLLRAPPILPFCIDFCDRALCDRALPLLTRKLTGVGIPWILLSPGVLKKGVQDSKRKKGYTPVILHRFLITHRNIASFFKNSSSMLHHLLRAPPILPFCIDFCDRALCDRALPLPTRKLTGSGIPLLLRLGVLKKGECKTLCEKRVTPPQYCIVF